MKKINTLFLLLALAFSVAMQAQDKNNPFAIVIGTNAVDFYPTNNTSIPGEMGSGGMFSDFFNVGNHWNMVPAVSTLELKYYAGDGFSTKLSGSLNQISKLGSESTRGVTFYNIGGGVQYNFKNLLKSKTIDPFLGIGVGYFWLDNSGATTFDTDLGINFWFTDNIAFTIKSAYMSAFEDDNFSYFQHTAGFTLAVGGKDSDGDGVYDKYDECLNTPGLEEFNGCPDSDGDGVPDKDDECPDAPGLAEFNGCPDTDGDGIADPEDKCPEVAGIPEFDGCPDTDGDGVPDNIDECPDEAGPKDNNGCPYTDTDGDGVPDEDDLCPEVAGTKANNGCPEMTDEVLEELNVNARGLGFEFDKETMFKNTDDKLMKIVEILKAYPNTKFTVEGHTDEIGSAKYNMELSEARAMTVKKSLVENGIEESRLSTKGYGKTQPISTDSSKNRRVEMALQK
jgi:outer membrane protein OmpA-like peptidoglycan-associated protein